jgi:hypothetical protein
VRLTAREDDLAACERPRPVELVRRQHDGPPIRSRSRDQIVEYGAAFGIETRMGLVEEKEPRSPGERDGERQTAALTGGEPGVADVGEAREPDSIERSRRVIGVRACCPCGEDEVLADGEVVVAERLVTHESEVAAMRASVEREVVTQDGGLTGMEGNEPGEEAEERRLPGTVAPREEDDLSLDDVEVDTGERREAAEEAHGRAETDDGLHSASYSVVARGSPA